MKNFGKMWLPELEDFSKLEDFLESSELNYRESILKYYKELGEKLGFTTRENFSVIKYTLNLGQLDLLWVEPKITFTLEFSSLENLLKELVKIVEFAPSLAVLILSSTSTNCKPHHVSKFITNSKLFSKEEIVILDLAEKKVIEL